MARRAHHGARLCDGIGHSGIEALTTGLSHLEKQLDTSAVRVALEGFEVKVDVVIAKRIRLPQRGGVQLVESAQASAVWKHTIQTHGQRVVVAWADHATRVDSPCR